MREKSWIDLPPTNRSRETELYSTIPGAMYRTPSDTFNFKAYGRQLYAMPYAEARVLFRIVGREGGYKSIAIETLRAFRPQLSLKEAGDIIDYLAVNFEAV